MRYFCFRSNTRFCAFLLKMSKEVDIMPAKDYNKNERFALVVLAKHIISEGHDVTARINTLTKSWDISSMTIRRWIERYDKSGIKTLERNRRSDRGISRTTCRWAVKCACSLLNSQKSPLSLNQLRIVLQFKVPEAGSDFCNRCRYACSCRMSGDGIKVGDRHSLSRTLSCAKCTKSH